MQDLPRASRNLRKHGDSQSVTQWWLLAMAVGSYIAAKISDEPVMPALIYGEWVTSFPAEDWAIWLMVAAFVYLAGIMLNGSWRWSPLPRLIGAAWHMLTLGLFSVSAMTAQYGDLFSLATAILTVLHGWFCWLNMEDLKQAVKYGPDNNRRHS
jgi:hypothetical protein